MVSPGFCVHPVTLPAVQKPIRFQGTIMNASLEKVSKQVSGFSLFLSALLIIVGFLAIMLPIASSFGVVIVIAWLLMISGVIQFVHAFRSSGIGSTLWKLAVAVIYF